MKTLFLSFLLTAFSGFASAQVKTPQGPAVKTSFTESLQVVVVTTKDSSAVQGTARLFERNSSKSKWKTNGESFPVVIGRNGLAWSEDLIISHNPLQYKREGDGRSPSGLFPLTFVFGSSTKPEKLKFPYIKLEQFTECVDDVNSGHYNKIVDRMKVGNLDWKSSEKMLAVGLEYELGVFVAHNSYPVVRGNGSCIFLHIWKNANSGTSGCTAMERSNLEKILGWLEPEKNPYLIQLTEGLYKTYRKSWNLPKLK